MSSTTEITTLFRMIERLEKDGLIAQAATAQQLLLGLLGSVGQPEQPALPEQPQQPQQPQPPAAGNTGENFGCKDFQKMVELGIFPEGTTLYNKRRGDKFRAVIKMENLPCGAREAKISSEPDPALGWKGGVFSSPSGYVKKTGSLVTANNPTPVMARNGWDHLHVGSQDGPTLKAVRSEWEAKGVDAAKQMVQAA